MSLCRLGPDSDVYAYEAKIGRLFVCQWCTLDDCREVQRTSKRAMRRHLRRHVERGEKAPRDAFKDLQ